ncbi:MAG: FHA domain-containing protein [Propionibacteriaceae bacterium]|nr:FHA domain-containing protein [Propionibacteriaceae bacterium]
MFTCPECGQQIADGVNFCSNCGAALRTNTGDTTRVIPVASGAEGSLESTDPSLPVLKDVPPGASALAVVRGPNVGATYILDQETVTVGRHPQSDIFLDDVTVSRHHARFTERGGHTWVADLNSLNGTYVNRTLIDGEVALRSGDEVQIGKFRLVYMVARPGRG